MCRCRTLIRCELNDLSLICLWFNDFLSLYWYAIHIYIGYIQHVHLPLPTKSCSYRIFSLNKKKFALWPWYKINTNPLIHKAFGILAVSNIKSFHSEMVSLLPASSQINGFKSLQKLRMDRGHSMCRCRYKNYSKVSFITKTLVNEFKIFTVISFFLPAYCHWWTIWFYQACLKCKLI